MNPNTRLTLVMNRTIISTPESAFEALINPSEMSKWFTTEHVADNRVLTTPEHSGLRSQADYEDMKGGWSWALDSLKSYLETGQPIVHEEWVKAWSGKK